MTQASSSMAQLEQQAAALRQRIAQLDSAVLAFSGGVDSSLLAALGSEILGDKLKMQAIPWKKTLIFLLVSTLLLGMAFVLRPHVCCLQCLM